MNGSCVRLLPLQWPRAADIARLRSGRIVAAFAECACRSDESAGRYTTSKPISATYGRRASQSAKVPCLPGSRAVERGKNSYQELKRARTGSTTKHEFAAEIGREAAVGITQHRLRAKARQSRASRFASTDHPRREELRLLSCSSVASDALTPAPLPSPIRFCPDQVIDRRIASSPQCASADLSARFRSDPPTRSSV